MLWGGRFSKKPKEALLEFNSGENVTLDSRLVTYDILGSVAHVKMLKKQGILQAKEADEILNALKQIYKKSENGEFELTKDLEDVHTAVENAVTKITSNGKNMHIARSRNDQVLLDMRMYMRDEIINLLEIISSMQEALTKLSKKDSVFPAYTHTRIAQPITLSFYCDSYVKSLDRDKGRLMDCYKRVNQNPLGAGAVAGTSWNIDRKYTTELLGFESVQENALDTISSRGEMEAEFVFALSMVMMKLSKISEELIWLSQKGLVIIPDDYCTGSSMMPNKKNADFLELIRGRTARIYGNLMHILITLKGTPSGYNSDSQETKYALLSAINTTTLAIQIMADVLPKLEINESKVKEELEQGFSQATEIADLLVKKGIPFRDSHKLVGELIQYCESKGKVFGQTSSTEANKIMNVKLSEKEWIATTSLLRERLKTKITFQKSDFAENEKRKLEKIGQNLIGA
ncbi:MAG: argininosuccinate lyase [Candidatus Micrarchaeota archaeon]|nr:argininosuccinate lyase [Candidatus Micrarchaeota archaeon]